LACWVRKEEEEETRCGGSKTTEVGEMGESEGRSEGECETKNYQNNGGERTIGR
jgi:hypothetical protein